MTGEGAVLLTTVHELYIAVMWVFSTVQYKFAVYENRSISDMTEEVLSYSKHAETMRKIWANHQRISKILTIHFQNNTCVSRKNTNYCFWTFHLRKVSSYSGMHYDFEHYIPNLNQITSYELNATCFWKIWSRSMVLIIRYINCVIYSSCVGLSNICIQITGLESHAQWCEQPTVVKRLINVIRRVDNWYSSHVGLFHSSIQIRCLWKPKHIWYDEEVLSYSKHAETMRKIWANHQRISKILTIHFQTHAWVVRIPIIVFERFICESFIVFWHALWLWGLYPYLNQITSYELNVTCFWKIWSRSMVLTIQYINCVIYSSYVGLSSICIQITGLESHAQWCWAT